MIFRCNSKHVLPRIFRVRFEIPRFFDVITLVKDPVGKFARTISSRLNSVIFTGANICTTENHAGSSVLGNWPRIYG